MKLLSTRRVIASGLVGFIALMAPSVGKASTFDVAAGWDLFKTDPAGTSFPGLGPLMGVPEGTFDFNNTFGRGIGVQNVGDTDTIIQRTAPAIASPQAAGGTATVGLLMQALQLETVVPVNFAGNGVDNYFVTLQSARATGGPASTGTITITWDATGLGGTFSSAIDVFFDIRKTSLTGAIVLSSDLVLSSSTVPWTDLPPAGALQIVNVNEFLSGTAGDRTQDFWPVGAFQESHPNGSVHEVRPSDPNVPEPASVVLLGIGTLVLGARGWRRRAG
jgi:hypothetical protein